MIAVLNPFLIENVQFVTELQSHITQQNSQRIKKIQRLNKNCGNKLGPSTHLTRHNDAGIPAKIN